MQSLQVFAPGTAVPDAEECREKFQAGRAEILEAAAGDMRRGLDSAILGSGLNDAHGKIRSWQARFNGSGGGYTALRAQKGETGANSPGAITNYLESGHRVRYPSGSAERYRPEVHVARARAFGFYRSMEAMAKTIEAQVRDKAEALLKQIMEGGNGNDQ